MHTSTNHVSQLVVCQLRSCVCKLLSADKHSYQHYRFFKLRGCASIIACNIAIIAKNCSRNNRMSHFQYCPTLDHTITKYAITSINLCNNFLNFCILISISLNYIYNLTILEKLEFKIVQFCTGFFRVSDSCSEQKQVWVSTFAV